MRSPFAVGPCIARGVLAAPSRAAEFCSNVVDDHSDAACPHAVRNVST